MREQIGVRIDQNSVEGDAMQRGYGAFNVNARGRQITLHFSCRVKTGNSYTGKRWERVPWTMASHVFVVVGANSYSRSRVATYYPDAGWLYFSENVDKETAMAVRAVLFSLSRDGSDTVPSDYHVELVSTDPDKIIEQPDVQEQSRHMVTLLDRERGHVSRAAMRELSEMLRAQGD